MRIFSLDRSDPETISASLSRTLKPHSSPVIFSAVDATSTLLATGGADGVVKIWDIVGGYTTHTFHGHSGVISALHFFKVDLKRKRDPEPSVKPKKRRKSEADDEDADADGISALRLASGDEEGKIRIWHLQKRKCAAVLDSHVSVVRGLDFDEDEQLLLSGSRDKTAMLWDAATWTSRTTIPVLESVETACFVPGRKAFATGGENGRLRVWWITGQEATEPQAARAEEQGIVHIICSEALSSILAISADQNIVLHSLDAIPQKSGSTVAPLPILRRISGTHDEVIDLAYVGGSDKLIAVATNTEEVKILSLDSEGAQSTSDRYFGADVGVLQGHEDIVISLAVDWSGHWLATGAKDNTARLWRIDASTGSYTCCAIFTGHAESLGAVALPTQRPPTGSPAQANPLEHPPPYLVTGSQDKTIKRWDTSKLQALPTEPQKGNRANYTRKAHDKDINAIDISHDSRFFASASQDRTVKIWSLEDGEAVGVLRGHKRGVWSVAFAPKDTPAISGEMGSQASSSRGLVITGSGDKTVKLWSLTDYSCLRTFEGHTNSVLKVLWMPPAPKIDRSNDFDDEDHEMALDVPETNTDTQPSPPQLASAGSDGLVKIWDATSGETACTLDNHTDRVWAVAVAPTPSPASASASESTTTTRTLVSGASDAVLTFWTDTTSSTYRAATFASNARIEQDQALQNHIRTGSYREAITLALALNHPARLLGLLTSVVNTYPREVGSLTGVCAVDEVLGGLGDEQLFALLGRVRDWNTNAKSAGVSQRVLWALLRLYPASRFVNLRASGSGKANGGIKEMLDALRVYTERHYRRWEELMDESWLVEYTLGEMDGIGGGIGALTNGAGVGKVNGHGNEKGDVNGDVMMLE